MREEDVLAYAERADEIILPPVFSSAAGSPRRKDPDQRIRKSAFLRIWAKEPDALTPVDVQKLTGYTGSTVRHWIRKGKLRSVTVQGITPYEISRNSPLGSLRPSPSLIWLDLGQRGTVFAPVFGKMIEK